MRREWGQTSQLHKKRNGSQIDPGNNEPKDTGFISKFNWSENGKEDWLIYYWPGERAKEEMGRAKTKIIGGQREEYLLGSKEEVKLFSKDLSAAPTAQVGAQAEGKTSKMHEAAIEEKKREIIKEWINSGRIKDINNK